ncbi:MAG: hypothetical protein KC643_30050 [Nitrospira sp.]|nr:hypothetical protein [Nitrospira sp.]
MQKINPHPPKRNHGLKDSNKDRINISDEALQRARERVSLGGDRWQEMAWYVNFSTLDFNNMSDGDLLNVQEEIIAICHNVISPFRYDLPTRDKIKPIQEEIAKHLKAMVETGSTRLGPFSYFVFVSRNPYATAKIAVNPETREILLPTLRFQFSELLPFFADSFFRCPKCQKIFLQFRRHAKFCSRICQSRAAMETIREKKKHAKLETKPSTKNHQGTASKRRK